MAIDIRIPDVGENVTQATVVQWHRKVGERVEAGQPLVDVMTDKVTVEIASPESGVLLEILHGPDEELKVGTVIGRLGQ
jgi:pyruvate/2-oxoglutarate dehydrogenase complex dihydrolipoamide acyltransferase (E2) component